MKKITKYYSGIGLTKTSVAIGLSALLCVPTVGHAEGVAAKTLATQAVQQSRNVTGQIVDELGEPMIGVTIKVKDSKTAAITDFDGNFTIAAQPSDVLEISYIGYKPLSVKANKTTLSLKMEPDNTGLEEVVVIGYGVQKKRDLTGAISSVKSEDITISPMPNPVEALQGKVAGLDITRSSGQAGASSTMQLRGTRSLEASGDPLVLIDGMAGDLTTLNANDIESIEVLKDAASTAVYGSAGANGIIIVTTKSGKEGRVKVNLNSYIGINGWSTVPKMHDANAYFNIKKQAQIAGNTYTTDEMVLGEEVYAAYMNGETIDWADELLKTGVTQNYSLSVSGGSEKTKAYMSMNFSGEDGQYDNDNYRIYSTNMKIDHKINKILSVGMNLQGSYTHKNTAYAKLETLLRTSPIGSLYDEEGNVNPYPVVGDNKTVNLLVNNHGTYRNNNQNTKIYLNPYIRINPLKGLSFESRLQVSLSYSKTDRCNGIGA